MTWDFTVITPSGIEPITLDEARKQCSLDGTTDHDDKLSGYIRMARQAFEQWTPSVANQQTIEQVMDSWPRADRFCLIKRPAIAVSLFTWTDSGGTVTTMASGTDYLLDTSKDPAEIVLPYNGNWPTATLYPASPVKVRYTAGLGRDIAFTAAVTDICTATAHGLTDGRDVLLRTTSSLPTGLALDTRYYIRDAAADTFKLAATPGGSGVDITAVGSGVHTLTTGISWDIRAGMLLMIGMLFTQREEVIVGQTATIATRLPLGVDQFWANARY